MRPNSIFSLKPSLAATPHLDKINEHARTFSYDFCKVLFRPHENNVVGPWDKKASPHILTGTHESNYCQYNKCFAVLPKVLMRKVK